MANRYLIEGSATDGYKLEDGSGVLLLEGVNAPGWDIQNATPVFRHLSNALIPFLFFVPLTPPAVSLISVDCPVITWTTQIDHSGTVEPLLGGSAGGGGETITADKWAQPTQQRRSELRRSQNGVHIISDPNPGPGTVNIDKWGQPTEKPRIDRKPALSFFVLGDVPRAEAVSFDRWNYPQSIPRRDVQRRLYSYFFAENLFNVPGVETIRLDKWIGSRPDILLRQKKSSVY